MGNRTSAFLAGALMTTTMLTGTTAVVSSTSESDSAVPEQTEAADEDQGIARAVDITASPTGEQTIDQVLDNFRTHGPGAPVMVAAHRGYWRGAPENSLEAVDLAVENGADVVEIDVRVTSDGYPILMHDTTVNRTTNGSGAVSSMTLEQIKELRLKEGLGGGQAPLTEHRVPTLAEAMQMVQGRAMVNLDKAWPNRDVVYDVLEQTDTVDHGIFKSTAAPAAVAEFRSAHSDALYMHIVNAGNADHVGALDRPPHAYEVVFARLTEPQVHPELIERMKQTSRVWANSLWDSLAAGYTDEASLIDVDTGWGALVERHGFDMIQTDNQDALLYWLGGGDPADWGKATARSVRVQAEDYATDGKDVGYHDQDDANRGGAARTYEGVDICSKRGSVDVCWIRAGEWLKYTVEIRVPGRYLVSARVSSPYDPAGRFHLDYGDARSASFNVGTTTAHEAFQLQEIEKRHFDRGTHEFYVRVEEGHYQNFNLDYIQFDRVPRR